MRAQDELAARFQMHRDHLLAIAHRMLGARAEAEDAVQETWLRLSRVDATEIGNLGGWLRTVLSRLCLDALRARRETPVAAPPDRPATGPGSDPEGDTVLADSVGRALLVVLDRLAPAERVAFVLHDVFAVPFDEIAPIVDRTPVTTKKLASRARHKVHGAPTDADLSGDRHVVEAFLAAARSGDVDRILAVLAPDVVRTADRFTLRADRPARARGARSVAGEIAVFGLDSRFAEPALVDGAVGVVVAPAGRLRMVLAMTVADGLIMSYELVGDPARLRAMDIVVLAAPGTFTV